MSELKWSANDVIKFLSIYRKYECLWNITCADYLKREVKRTAFEELLIELETAGIPAQEDALKKKIKILRDAYRNEINKIKKSKKSGASADAVYKPKLLWFSTADEFWNHSISGRQSSSNLDLSTLSQSSQEEVPIQGEELEEDCNDSSQSAPVPVQQSCSLQIKKKAQGCMEPPPQPSKVLKTGMNTKYPSRFEAAVSKLQNVAEIVAMETKSPEEDQYDKFAQHIASQLRELPIRSFITLQQKFQNLITNERLNNLDAMHSTITLPSPSTTADGGVIPVHYQQTHGLDVIQRAILNFDSGTFVE